MAKRLIAVILSTALALSMATVACSNGVQDDNKKPPVEEPEEPDPGDGGDGGDGRL